MRSTKSALSKEFTTIIQERGQINLPAEVRHGLKLKAKQRVTIRYNGEEIIIKPEKKSLKDYFGAFGKLPKGVTVEQAIKEAREARAEDIYRKIKG